MWTSDQIVDALEKRGDLWQPAPGLVSLRGDALALFRRIEALLAAIADDEAMPEWRVAPGLDFATLAKAHYFESFPQWLTGAGHLSDDPASLESVACSPDPAAAAARSLQPAGCALSPALCYHAYERLAGSEVDTVRLTVHGTCWRHEQERLAPLERGWAFTMREFIVVGDSSDVESLRTRGMELARLLANALGLAGEIVPASDPFFAPTARGKALLQKVKGLKHELRLDIGAARSVAAASFNDHEGFFGECFDIRTRGGATASSGCVAFGVERWLLAFLVAHGPSPAAWPRIDLAHEGSGRASSW
jgi:hypothetical protein